jgi:three-Cys-motif partner protein
MEYSGIGEWSQAKLEIVRDYGKEYSKILANQ